MAVLAMDQSGYLVADALPGGTVAASPAQVDAALAAGRVPVIAPFAWLRASDPLPHGWAVTSDSIAAWLTGQLGAARLVLLKAVDGLRGETGAVQASVDRSALALAAEVDRQFFAVLPPTIGCWIVSGRHPERLRELLECGQTAGTRVR